VSYLLQQKYNKTHKNKVQITNNITKTHQLVINLCPWKTSCDSSTIFHIRTLPSRAPDVTTRSCDRTSMFVILSWWPNLTHIIPCRYLT